LKNVVGGYYFSDLNHVSLIIRNILLVTLLLLAYKVSFSQAMDDSLLSKVNSRKLSALVERKADDLEGKLISKSERTLNRLQKQEKKIYKKMLSGKDSLMAEAALADISSKYESIRTKIKSPVPDGAKQYIPRLDTLNTVLKFLSQNGAAGKVHDALSTTEALQSRFQQAEDIKKFIRERKQQLKDHLDKIGSIKQLKNFNKEAYYYSKQIKEYKAALHDSKKAERKAIELLSKTKPFQDFMRKNSMLASLFRLPGGADNGMSQASLAGLQTRSQVNNLIQQQIFAGGPNAMAQFQQNLQSAQSQISQLKDKIIQSDAGSSDDIMPEGFRPNNQKTKSFRKRIEYGTNIQSQKPNGYFPVTSDLGLSVGYKLNDKSVIGLGASYKIGWGQSIKHIDITNQGAGLRSYVDWKLKGSFWISGGYEMNYHTEFNRIDQLKDMNAWQQSGLVGISKVIDVKSKFFKKTKLQLLWDFLSYSQVPRTVPILFRLGYQLK